jgi:predicted metal-dependent hydrolase
MTELVVRRLLVDLNTPFAARWNGGDAFRSAFFNALSMSFPLGEQYFIDTVRSGLKALPESEQEKFAAQVAGFIGQEATHRRVHALFNGHLAKLGFDNWIERHGAARLARYAHRHVRVHLASTAATEHFTALFASWIMRHPEAFDGCEPRLKTLWMWHSAEESEHRNTAVDVFMALSGDLTLRSRVFKYITVVFMADLTRQTIKNLWHDGSLFQWRTWQSAAQLLFAKDGMFRGNVQAWRDYLAPRFHPNQQEAELSRLWLQDNTAQFSVVG